MDIKNIGPLPQTPQPVSRNVSHEPPVPTNSPPKALSEGSAITIPSFAEVDDATSEENKSQTLNQSVDTMNNLMKSLNNSLRFSIDDDTGKTVVKVIDSSTQEVIKQFPSEEALALTKALDKLTGLLVEQQV